ncbi:MAG: Fur family transcriptional regulator [Bacteroidota bacterium]
MDNNAAKESFTDFLRAGEYRITPERFQVLEAVLSSKGHFEATELYLKMRSAGKKVSRATVYNTLDLLLKTGFISKYRFAENHSRYEKVFGRPHHHHLICLDCGEITEFVSEKVAAAQSEICREKKFKPQSATFQIFGVCSNCASNYRSR